MEQEIQATTQDVREWQNKNFYKQALDYAYDVLKPFSERFTVDKKRLLFSIELVSKAVGDLRGKRILDMGSGIGLTCLAFKKLGAEAQGIDKYIFDPADPLFHIADVNHLQDIWKREGLAIQAGDFFIADLSSYDVIMSDATIEHLRNPKEFILRMNDVVRPGGFVFIGTPNLSTMLRRIRFVFGRSPLWTLRDYYDLGESFTGHWREYTLQELKQMCEWSGLQVVGMWNKNMLAPFKWRWEKMPRFIARLLSVCVPGSRDSNFLLCKRPL
ncbi:MAG TPA: hypothetical protein DDW36_01225 [Candidatus Magasanikbacteria bacterium]|nr:hypothetical protein [Candidatus Magasanikbacteria bacterium]